jgi:hypothetical protein
MSTPMLLPAGVAGRGFGLWDRRRDGRSVGAGMMAGV